MVFYENIFLIIFNYFYLCFVNYSKKLIIQIQRIIENKTSHINIILKKKKNIDNI